MKKNIKVVYYLWLKETNEIYIGKSALFRDRLRKHKERVSCGDAYLYQRIREVLGEGKGKKAFEYNKSLGKIRKLSEFGRFAHGEFFFLGEESRRFVLETALKEEFEIGILCVDNDEERLLDVEGTCQRLIKDCNGISPLFIKCEKSDYLTYRSDVKKTIMQVSPNSIAHSIGLLMDIDVNYTNSWTVDLD